MEALTTRFAKNTEHDTSKVRRLPCKMTMEVYKVLRLPGNLQIIFWNRRKSIAPATQNDFRQVCRHVKMSGSATPATQNESTTCSCSFPYRHGDVTGKTETRDETRWSIKTKISCETSSNFAIRSFKIDVFLRVFLRTDLKINVSREASMIFHHLSQNTTSATESARCRHFAQRWQCDSPKK